MSAGAVTARTLDPDGAALATTTTYEAPGPGAFFRPLTTTAPAGTTSTQSHYGPTESVANPCGGGSANQGGLPRSRTGPDPDGAGPAVARVEEVVYDARGRPVASRVGTEGWSCSNL